MSNEKDSNGNNANELQTIEYYESAVKERYFYIKYKHRPNWEYQTVSIRSGVHHRFTGEGHTYHKALAQAFNRFKPWHDERQRKAANSAQDFRQSMVDFFNRQVSEENNKKANATSDNTTNNESK